MTDFTEIYPVAGSAVEELAEKNGLLLRELAPGHTVEEVQAKTEPVLLIADDLKEMAF